MGIVTCDLFAEFLIEWDPIWLRCTAFVSGLADRRSLHLIFSMNCKWFRPELIPSSIAIEMESIRIQANTLRANCIQQQHAYKFQTAQCTDWCTHACNATFLLNATMKSISFIFSSSRSAVFSFFFFSLFSFCNLFIYFPHQCK